MPNGNLGVATNHENNPLGDEDSDDQHQGQNPVDEDDDSDVDDLTGNPNGDEEDPNEDDVSVISYGSLLDDEVPASFRINQQHPAVLYKGYHEQHMEDPHFPMSAHDIFAGCEPGQRAFPKGIPMSLLTSLTILVDVDSCSRVTPKLRDLLMCFDDKASVGIRTTVCGISNSFRFNLYVKGSHGYRHIPAKNALSFKLGTVVSGNISHTLFWLVADENLCNARPQTRYSYQNSGKRLLAWILNEARQKACIRVMNDPELMQHSPVLSQLNVVNPGVIATSKHLDIGIDHFEKFGSPDWKMNNVTMLLIAEELDNMLSDLSSCPFLSGDRLVEVFGDRLAKSSCFVCATAGTKGLISRDVPITITNQELAAMRSQIVENDVDTFNSLVDELVISKINHETNRSWLTNALSTTLYPNINRMVAGRESVDKTILLDIGYSLCFTNPDLFLLSHPKHTSYSIADLTHKSETAYISSVTEQQVPVEGASFVERMFDEEEQNDVQDALDSSDFIGTMQDSLMRPFAEDALYNQDDGNNPSSDIVDGTGTAGETTTAEIATTSTVNQSTSTEPVNEELPSDDELYPFNPFQGQSISIENQRYWFNALDVPSVRQHLPDLLDATPHVVPGNSSSHSQRLAFLNNIRCKMIKKRSKIYRYVFGTRYGNTHTGQPSIHVLDKDATEVFGSNSVKIVFPPPGVCGAQTYLSGEKNINFCLRHNIKPEVMIGFGEATELLLRDKFFLSGERKRVEKEWLTAFNIVQDQQNFEKELYDRTRNGTPTADSNLVLRVELMCVTNQHGVLNSIPFPSNFFGTFGSRKHPAIPEMESKNDGSILCTDEKDGCHGYSQYQELSICA